MQEALWWTPHDESEVVVAPTRSNSILAVVRELRLGLAQQFPMFHLCATRYGVLLDGVGQGSVGGLLEAVGLNGPTHNVVDTDILLLADDANLPAECLRSAVTRTIAQPCALAAVSVIGGAHEPQHDAWLTRVPTAGRGAVEAWQARGSTLLINGHYVKIRLAPHTCARTRFCFGSDSRAQENALAQRACGPTQSDVVTPIFLRTTHVTQTNPQTEVKKLRHTAWREPACPGITTPPSSQ